MCICYNNFDSIKTFAAIGCQPKYMNVFVYVFVSFEIKQHKSNFQIKILVYSNICLSFCCSCSSGIYFRLPVLFSIAIVTNDAH